MAKKLNIKTLKCVLTCNGKAVSTILFTDFDKTNQENLGKSYFDSKLKVNKMECLIGTDTKLLARIEMPPMVYKSGLMGYSVREKVTINDETYHVRANVVNMSDDTFGVTIAIKTPEREIKSQIPVSWLPDLGGVK